MIRFLEMVLTGILVSFFFFPFEFAALPGVNTKMMLAVLGLVFIAIDLIRRRSFTIPKEFLLLIALASAVSLASLLSVALNQTPDNTYATYIISFSVWLSAAYAVCRLIRAVHGRIDVPLTLNYLAAVCVFQCAVALLIDGVAPVRRFVDSTFLLSQELMHGIDRLYGIGAELDVAGARFSAVLVAIAFYLSGFSDSLKPFTRICYIIALLFISIIGCMIARTTLVGVIIGLATILAGLVLAPKSQAKGSGREVALSWIGILLAGIVLCIVLYDTDPRARKLFRFGFEGFFSLVENGHWEISSTEKLKTMVVFPEKVHTWIIGDGYFLNSRYDVNYLGDATDQGYYMGTDVGYLRFIFYFGIVGLIPMVGVIVYSALVCMRRFRQEWLLFLLALLVGLTVWMKVSTDIFLFFALFLGTAALQETTSA